MIFRQPPNDAVVDDHAGLVEHHGVAGHADLEVGEPSGIDALEELSRMRAEHFHLAERADVDDADALRTAVTSSRTHSPLLLPATRVVLGPLPVARRHPDRAQRLVAAVQRRAALGSEAAPGRDATCGTGWKNGRAVVVPTCSTGLPRILRQDAQRIHVRSACPGSAPCRRSSSA